MKMLIVVLGVAAVLAAQACRSTSTPSAEEAGAPSGAVGEATMVTVRGWIDAVDKTNRTVTLKGPRGGTVTLDVKDPKKLDAVEVGDPVVAAFIEALALDAKKLPAAPPAAGGREPGGARRPGERPSGAAAPRAAGP